MNTAKTLQLLDLQSNNISPATNIESIYYEVMDGGVIYRNSLYRHFPIYVKYNNNIDDPIGVNRTNDNKSIQFFNDNQEDTLIGNAPSFRLSQSAGARNDIFISSIRQSHLKNTRYYKLDISTYNFSDIMSLYAPKLWVKNKFETLDTCIGHITYDSSIITNYSEQAPYIRTTEDVGNIEKGTLGSDLTTTDIDGNNIPNKHVVNVNDLLDKILFKEIRPYIFDASVYMEEVCTSGNIVIANGNINDTLANYRIISNPGKLQIVYNADDSTVTPNPINTKLKIRTYLADDEYNYTENGVFVENKPISLNDCEDFYNNTILGILEKLYTVINSSNNIKKTPNLDYDENDVDSLATWNTFEQNVINTIKDTLKIYFSTDELNNIDWKEIIIKNIYTDKVSQYPQKNKTIQKKKFQVSNEYSLESVIGKCFCNDSTGIFTDNIMFKNEYYIILKNTVKILSDKLNGESPEDNSDKTNFGNTISPEDCSNYIYGVYQLPYNDYNNTSNTISLKVKSDSGGNYIVDSSINLYHKFIINVPIIINNKTVYITGAKDQYIDYLQDTAEDTVIKIPEFIDGAKNGEKLPELYAISQGGIFMPANNWEIYSTESDAIYNTYTIKAQKPYDNAELSINNKRTIKIRIYTKYSVRED